MAEIAESLHRAFSEATIITEVSPPELETQVHPRCPNRRGPPAALFDPNTFMTSSLRLNSVTFRVADLARSRDFYVRRLGFAESGATDERLELATSPDAAPILTLLADRPGAARPPPDAAGLFHAALLLPSRAALASWLQFGAAQGLEFEGFSDHGVSEAIYLSDPDGNGLEFYADRPREQWPFAGGEVAMTTRPLAIRSLLDAAQPTLEPLIATAWGHLHLRVTDLARSEKFYRETLGVVVMQRNYPGARFLGADGYHHHLGLNTWGNPRIPRPPGTTGLVEAVFARAGTDAAREIFDPDGIRLRVLPLAIPAVTRESPLAL